jgi:NAD(P)-dependent dehydrogenase (short-subunit alcohol dehydrogenase family)
MHVAIVTGGSSGIGQRAALRIAKRGAGVILTYDTDQPGALDTVAAIEEDGGTAVALPLDVGKTETFPAFRESVAAALRGTWRQDTFDLLVNNAGFGQMSMFEDTPEGLFDRFRRVMLKGPCFLTRTLLPLLADGGAIVNTTGNLALFCGLEERYPRYASMKDDLTVLTRYMAREFSKRGIRVNSVAPGSTLTRIADVALARSPG